MATSKDRSGSSELLQKTSPRVSRQLRPTFLDTDTVSSSNKARTTNVRSPRVTERRSPRSPVPERKRPSKISELENQISQLQLDLKKLKDELDLSESCKKQAEKDAEDSKNQLVALQEQLLHSEKRLQELSASEGVIEVQNISKEHKETCDSELDVVPKQILIDPGALFSSVNQIQHLKNQLELAAKSESEKSKHAELAEAELQILKVNLAETLQVVENMKGQLINCRQSEADAQALAGRTLQQLETAKRTVEALREDAAKSVGVYDSVAFELEQSKARVKFLEEVMSRLQIDLSDSNFQIPSTLAGDRNFVLEAGKLENDLEEANSIKQEMCSLRSENERLRSLLETAECKNHQEQIQRTVEITNAYELVEQMKSESTAREAELQVELEKRRSEIEELKADLMDKETHLQGFSEENERLNLKLKQKLSYQGDSRSEDELKTMNECINKLKAHLMDKETKLQIICEENQKLKLDISKRETEHKEGMDVAVKKVESARVAEREALVKLGIVMEEADRSNRKVARVTEQLEAAQAANSEMEAELRRLKVQSNQWRKAAETAVAILAAGNGDKFNYHSLTDEFSPYSEDIDDDFQKKKNVTMLKKIGVLWKKPHKY